MRGFSSRKKVLIGAGVLLFLFSLNVASSQVRGVALSLSAPLQSFLWQAGDNISTFLGGGRLRMENEALTHANLALLQEVVSLQDVAKENEDLRRMLDLEVREEFKLLMAEVIGKSLVEDVILVRAGEDKGIRKGMPVITAGKAVVGQVTEVFPSTASVQLISASESRTDAQVANTETTGIVRGEGGQRTLLDLVPQADELHPGDLLVTSTLGGVFPENLLIGEISHVWRTGAEPFQRAAVKPFFNLKSTDAVFIIVSLKP